MTSKEQLIEWMNEQRENLSFEKKTQLLWDYWHQKDVVPNLKKQIEDLTRDKVLLEKSKEKLEQEKANWEIEKEKISKKSLDALNDLIKKSQLLEIKSLDLLNEELSEENIRKEIIELESLFLAISLPSTYALLKESYQQLLVISLLELNLPLSTLAETPKEMNAKEKVKKDKVAQELQDLKNDINKLALNASEKKALSDAKDENQVEAVRTVFQARTKQEVQIDWSKILEEIYNFALTNPTTQNEITKFLTTKNYPDPLFGVDLQGIKKDELLKLKQGTATQQLRNSKGDFADYQNWTSLNSSSDGNCFLNSFSIYLVGNENLATLLRVKLCLWLMSNLDYVEIINGKNKVESLVDKLTINENNGINNPLAQNEKWLMTDDAKYFSFILSRPIRILYWPLSEQYGISTEEQKNYAEFVKRTGGWAKLDYIDYDLTYTRQEIWTICHVSGNHFEPLISPTPELMEAKTPLNEAFRKINQGIEGILNGNIAKIDYLDSGDFEIELENVIGSEEKEIYGRMDILLKKLGLSNLPSIKELYKKLKKMRDDFL